MALLQNLNLLQKFVAECYCPIGKDVVQNMRCRQGALGQGRPDCVFCNMLGRKSVHCLQASCNELQDKRQGDHAKLLHQSSWFCICWPHSAVQSDWARVTRLVSQPAV